MTFTDDFDLAEGPNERPSRFRAGEGRVEDPRMPAFFIGVVAQLTGAHPQTLRNYERIGLLRPGRSAGDVRMYSRRDVERVRRIRRLTKDLGVNLAGVEVILNLTEKLELMQGRYDQKFDDMERRHRDEINRLKAILQRLTR